MWKALRILMATCFISLVGCGSGGGSSSPVDSGAADRSPKAFSFSDVKNVNVGDWVVSDEIQVSGIDDGTRLSIEDGEYSLNGGEFEAVTAMINNNDRLMIRVFSSETPATLASARVAVGTFTASFDVTTSHDSIPDPLVFSPQENISAGVWATTNEVIVKGLSREVTLSVSNGEYSLNGNAFTTSVGSAENGDRLRLRTLVQGSLAETITVITLGGSEFIFSVVSKADSEAPEINVFFPPVNSHSDGGAVFVRGTVADVGLVKNVQVNGVDAVLSDDNKSWMVSVPLAPVSTDFNIVATDYSGNSREINSLSHVSSVVSLAEPVDLTVNPLNGEILVLDSVRESLVRVASGGGGGNLLFSNSTQISASLDDYPADVVFDGEGNRVFILEREGKEILTFDLNDKSLTTFSGNGSPGSGVPFGAVCSGLALDKKNNRLITLDLSERALIAIDIDTGYRSLLSVEDDSSGVGFTLGRRLAVDNDHDRILFTRSGSSVVQVDLSTHERSFFSFASPGAHFTELVDIEIDPKNSRALVLDRGQKKIFAIDLATEKRTLFAGIGYGSINNLLEKPTAMSLNEDGSKLMVVDAELGEIVVVDMETREQTIISSLNSQDQGQNFKLLANINLAGDKFLALGESLFEVDLQTGVRQVVSDYLLPELGPRWSAFPADLAVNAESNIAYIVDHNQETIYAVDLLNGARSIISSPTKPNKDNALLSPFGIALDADNNRLYVSDGSLRALLMVDITTGQRTIISDDTIGLGATFNFAITDIAYDDESGVVLVNDINANRVISVNLTTGNRSALTQAVFRDHRAITIDSKNNRAFVADRVNLDVKQVDLSTGLVTVITNNSMHRGRNRLKNPAGIVFDAINDRLLVADADLKSIIAVDPTTGDRIVFSQ